MGMRVKRLSRARRIGILVCVFGLLAPGLVACGKRGTPTLPPNERNEFPKAYPRVKPDPAPEKPADLSVEKDQCQ